ncbi:MAG: hypothetical protein ACJAT3_002230 [Akkermansiaceae bacterium]
MAIFPAHRLLFALDCVESRAPVTCASDSGFDDIPVFKIARTLDSVAYSIGCVEAEFHDNENLRVGFRITGVEGRVSAGDDDSHVVEDIVVAPVFCGI